MRDPSDGTAPPWGPVCRLTDKSGALVRIRASAPGSLTTRACHALAVATEGAGP